MKTIYLDYNATTPLHPEALEAMLPFLQGEGQFYGNPSSVHALGQKTRAAIEMARAKVARLISASPDEIIFTSCGSESDTTAIKGVVYSALERKKGRHIITSMVEHDTVLFCCEYLQSQGWDVTFLPVDSAGRVALQDVQKALRSDTALVSIMHANNEVGTLQPIAEIGALCRQRGVFMHTDAIQTVGKIPVDVEALNVDLLSLSAHKFYGPKGVGALYIRKGTRMHPLLHGHHEKNRRAGTENVAGIVGCAKALEISCAHMEEESVRIQSLRDRLEMGLCQRVPHVQINGAAALRIPGTSNLSFEFVEGEACVVMLDVEGIAVSTGSACASGSTKASHVLRAMGIPGNVAQGAIRFSLGKDNTAADVDHVLKVMPEVVDRLRSLSPLWSDMQQGIVTEVQPPNRPPWPSC